MAISKPKGIFLTTRFFLGCVGLLVLLATIPARTTETGPQRPARDAPSALRPLATTVQAILGIKVGERPYLAQYAAVMKSIRPLLRGRHPRPLAALMDGASPAAVKALRHLVEVLNSGSNPTDLRDQILARLALGGYLPVRTSPWRYGRLGDRVILSRYLTLRSRRLLESGQSAEASAYARAGLLLWCQDSVLLSGSSSLGYWFDNAMAPEVRQNARALKLTAAASRRLRNLYRSGLRSYGHFYSLKQPFFSNYFLIQRLGDKRLPKGLIGRYLSGLAHAIREAHGRLFDLYRVAGMVLDSRRNLNLGGHPRAAARIKVFLESWAARVKVDHTVPKLERSALLRWIKEASI